MTTSRIDIRSIRQEQIVEAAVAVIAEQGIQHFSLSEIEKKAGMSRGQLTYYFRSKEDIFLAVFDRLLELIYERMAEPGNPDGPRHAGWAKLQPLLKKVIGQPSVSPEFNALQYTFLSEIGHREDFRQRLATLYEEWRTHMAEELARDLHPPSERRPASPRAMATLILAILHGLGMQTAADPDAFQREEVLNLCVDMLGAYFEKESPGPLRTNGPSSNARGLHAKYITGEQS
jgi:AcrR family transcriptional regulator